MAPETPSQMITRRRRRRKEMRMWDGAIETQVIRKQTRLKASVWKKTPQDIILHLFNFLPLPSLCRFKCVSRSWYSGISSTTPSSGSSLFISFANHDLRLSNGRSWIDFPMTIRVSDSLDAVDYVSSSGGLVLATGCNWNVKFIVQNPGCAALLKPLSVIATLKDDDPCWEPVAFAGIQVLPSTLTSDGKISFVVVCATSGTQVLVHVFDSRRWSWVVESAPVMPGELGAGKSEVLLRGRKIRTTLLLQDEVLYFLTVSRSTDTRSLKSVNIWEPAKPWQPGKIFL